LLIFLSIFRIILTKYELINILFVYHSWTMDLLPLMEQKFSLVYILCKNPDKIPPIFIARAGMDNPLMNESLDKFITKALANNLYVDVYNHPTGYHAFDLFDDNKRTRDIVKKTLDFLKSILL